MAPKQSCAKYQYVLTPSGPKILPVPDKQSNDEENPVDYNTGGYLPVTVSDAFKGGRYVVIRKLGWGHFSTVWLVRDNQLNKHSAIKVVKSAGRYAETAHDEIKLLSLIARASPTHPGRNYIVSFLDSFSHNTPGPASHSAGIHRSNLPTFAGTPGPPSSHVCIVFEPLGESLLALIERNKKKGVARPVVKIIAKQVLLGLQYLHDECCLVHTDIKPENILISISDIESHIRTELTLSPRPTSRRVGVPLPPSPHLHSNAHISKSTRAPNNVAIPRRQVHIFDSQPLGSPGSSRSAKAISANHVVGGLTTTTSISSSSSSLRLPIKPVLKTSNPPGVTPPTAKSALLSQTPTMAPHSSSTSSSSSSSISSTLTSNTPATSLSNSSMFAMSCVMTSSNSTIPEVKLTTAQSDIALAMTESVAAGWTDTHRYEAGWRDSVASSLRALSVTSASSHEAGSTIFQPSPTAAHLAPSLLKPSASDSVQINMRRARAAQDTSGPPYGDSTRLSTSWTDRMVSLPKRPSLLSGKSSPIGPSSLPKQNTWVAAPAPAVIVAAVAAIACCGNAPESTVPEVVFSAPLPNPLPPVPSLLSRTAPSKLFSKHRIQSSSGSTSSTSSSVTPVPPTSPALEPASQPTTPPPTPASPTNASPELVETISEQDVVPEILLPPPIDTSLPPLPISIKIADLGNATPVDMHYTEDIQTRQYRAPEAILGRKDWGTNADVWSLACVLFELLTAEYLFDPQGQGDLFTKDDDHMAQIIELLGDFPLDAKLGGKYGREMFDSTGSLRYIRALKPWPLQRVMTDKYLYNDEDSQALADFLLPMLAPDFRNRKEARDMLDHPWLRLGEEEMEKIGRVPI